MTSLSEFVAAARTQLVHVYGVPNCYAALLCVELARAYRGQGLLAVVPTEADARQLGRDIDFFAHKRAALHVPGYDTSPYSDLPPETASVVARVAALSRIGDGHVDLVVCSARSLLHKVMPAAAIADLSFAIDAAQTIDRDDLVLQLVSAGYQRADIVSEPGEFAIRGGVVDLFPPTDPFPARIDLFGDEIESLRRFDPNTQRTLKEITTVRSSPARQTVIRNADELRRRILTAADTAAHPSKATRRLLESLHEGLDVAGAEALLPAFYDELVPLWSHLPPKARWLIFDPDAVVREVEDELENAQTRYNDRLSAHQIAFPPQAHYSTLAELTAELESPRRIHLARLELWDQKPKRGIRFEVDGNEELRQRLTRARSQGAGELLAPLANAITRWTSDDWRVAIACDSSTRADRLQGLLTNYDIVATPQQLDEIAPRQCAIVAGGLSAGFSIQSDKLAVVTDQEIFGERRRRGSPGHTAKAAHRALLGSVGDFSQLKSGDFLVHTTHGVGVYQGLAKLPLQGVDIDFLLLEYTGGNLYLPAYRLGEVQRYVGADGLKPRIDKLGGSSWATTRKKASRDVQAMAEELLQLYAQRAALPGHAFAAPDAMFREFEATFEFEETPDQQRAIDDVLADMAAAKPMDRLVCGDVGYGKTEVAMRAILLAVLDGKQAALLAPTTVLAEQHFQTLSTRLAGLPVSVAKLSRFEPRKRQQASIKGLAGGTIDVAVGTHRVLSKDVRFKDLGLLVVDEEQRFGVAHKERLKHARTQLDVLTLTATPIPRTLHLAVAGLRDLSIIATPPADRRAIRTYVCKIDDDVIREGIRRELARRGQVFFVAPRITDTKGTLSRTLAEWVETLSSLVPEARIAMAHGQMATEALERVMVQFVQGEFDVLVSTTIVENGLDIPRANTMFIANAQRLGLSQLYQLRGRIGRSKARAFCYLMVPPLANLTEEAKRRLEVLQRFSDLGAGFSIASHDLEIRGAGELLGRKQSGAIAAVGFESYATMLEDAVGQLKGEPIRRETDPDLTVDIPGYIPDDYLPDPGQRLDFYKRMASVDSRDDLTAILDEITDRYGPLPHEVLVLADLNTVKMHARKLGAQSVELSKTKLILSLRVDTPLSAPRLADMMQTTQSRYLITPDSRIVREFSASEQATPTQAAVACLLELGGYAT